MSTTLYIVRLRGGEYLGAMFCADGLFRLCESYGCSRAARFVSAHDARLAIDAAAKHAIDVAGARVVRLRVRSVVKGASS